MTAGFGGNREQRWSIQPNAEENDNKHENFNSDKSAEHDEEEYFTAKSSFSTKKKKKKKKRRKYLRKKTEVLNSSDSEASIGRIGSQAHSTENKNSPPIYPMDDTNYEGLSKTAKVDIINKEITEASKRRQYCLKKANAFINARSESPKNASQDTGSADLIESVCINNKDEVEKQAANSLQTKNSDELFSPYDGFHPVTLETICEE